jgi:hypothetical protein
MPELSLSLTPAGPPGHMISPPTGPASYPDYVTLRDVAGDFLGFGRLRDLTDTAAVYVIPDEATLPDRYSWSGDWRRLPGDDYLTLVEVRQFPLQTPGVL